MRAAKLRAPNGPKGSLVGRGAAADHRAHGACMNPAMMDMREVATRLSVSIRAVQRLVASG
jgi:hypothetical protein